MRNGLSKIQIICLVLLWVAFCVMLFIIPTSASMGENIFVVVVSAVILVVAFNKDRHRRRRRDHDE